jgi:hypothetical protein
MEHAIHGTVDSVDARPRREPNLDPELVPAHLTRRSGP